MAKKKSNRSVSYVIQRVALHPWAWSDEIVFSTKGSDEYASFVPVIGLRTKKAAEARSLQLEREARRSTPLGPFLRNLLPDTAEAIASAAARVGLSPPDLSTIGPAVGPTKVDHGGGLIGTSYGSDYFAYSDRVKKAILTWWQEHAAEITPEQNAALWEELFPEHRFYTVLRTTIEE